MVGFEEGMVRVRLVGFLHIVALLGFVFVHGVSAAMALRLRHERNPDRIRVMLQVSSSSLGVFYVSVALLLLGGVWAGVRGGWFHQGWTNTVGRSLQDLEPGEGAIVLVAGKKVAAFHDEAGEIVTLSPKCKHLGCTVGWNHRAKTWDCPCHGSRYDHHSGVINGPTRHPLDPIDVPIS